jgi:septum formation protein
MKLILASKSESRQKLLRLLGLPFKVVESGVKERSFTWDEPSEVVATLAAMKAEAVAKNYREQKQDDYSDTPIIIGADTVVSLDQEIIGQPADRQEAGVIIGKLAGKTHQVWTGVCVIDPITRERVVETEKSEVSFRSMTEKQIEKYLDTGEWQGKAGAYQLQGAIKLYVKDIIGSYTNVIGLPLILLAEMLEKMGVWVESSLEEQLMEEFGYGS